MTIEFDDKFEYNLDMSYELNFEKWLRWTNREKRNYKETEYTHFIKIIQNINPNCNFKLVELVDYNKENNHILAVSHKEEGYNLIRNNFISINLYNFRKDKKISHSEYPQNHLDWDSIFKKIINLVS